MLTQDEIYYLRKIPEKKKVKIKAYDPKVEKIASSLIKPIKKMFPELEILHMGASGLKISGQGDLDIYALTNPQNFEKYLDSIKKNIGEPKCIKVDSVSWKFSKGGYEIEFYLTNPESKPMKRQISVYKKLKGDPKILEGYKKLKESFDGKSFREYQKSKYEFYHKILD